MSQEERTEDQPSQKWILAVGIVFALLSGLAAFDLVEDLVEGTTAKHVIIEGATLLFCVLGLGLMTARYAKMRRREHDAVTAVSGLTRDLARSRAEAERWHSEARELLAGLGSLIDRQFRRWALSGAEKEVALLLLKGFSHKEVAALRGVSEATARQQAAAVYKKAGVSGRHDLSAFFLEDLLAPRAGPSEVSGFAPGEEPGE